MIICCTEPAARLNERTDGDVSSLPCPDPELLFVFRISAHMVKGALVVVVAAAIAIASVGTTMSLRTFLRHVEPK